MSLTQKGFANEHKSLKTDHAEMTQNECCLHHIWHLRVI